MPEEATPLQHAYLLVKGLRERVRELESEAFQAEVVVSEMLRLRHGLAVGELCSGRIELGGWECAGSPIGVCYYDKEHPEGSGWAECCLVCGQPSERK